MEAFIAFIILFGSFLAVVHDKKEKDKQKQEEKEGSK